MPPFTAVCSNRPRPMVQTSRNWQTKTGEKMWGRDVHHILDGDGSAPLYHGAKTLCGVDCSDWLTIGPVEELNDGCCKRCALKAGGVE